MNTPIPTGQHCSFCGKDNDAVQKLICGPGRVAICNECVGLCQEILAEATVPPVFAAAFPPEG